jgi:hypothetical protein
MGHDANHAAARTERFERSSYSVKSVYIECAEALVKEDRFHGCARRTRKLCDQIGKGKGKRERNEKRFATRQGATVTLLIGIAVVDDEEPIVGHLQGVLTINKFTETPAGLLCQ